MEFVEIFTQMQWLPAMLLIVGTIALLVEVFIPGFGFFGFAGAGSIVAGVIIRIYHGLNLTQSITLILMVLALLLVSVFIMVFSAKHGILGATGLFENKASLDSDFNKVPKELRKLIGKSGKTITDLSLFGKAKIRGKIYDVKAMSSFIDKNVNIKVVAIKDNEIVVRKWFE